MKWKKSVTHITQITHKIVNNCRTVCNMTTETLWHICHLVLDKGEINTITIPEKCPTHFICKEKTYLAINKCTCDFLESCESQLTTLDRYWFPHQTYLHGEGQYPWTASLLLCHFLRRLAAIWAPIHLISAQNWGRFSQRCLQTNVNLDGVCHVTSTTSFLRFITWSK